MKKVKLSEIALAAGVSRATVSLALRGSPLIAKPTAERVRAVAERLGYVYNRTAAALRNRKTHTIGLVEANFKNPFFAAMSESVEREIEQRGKALLFVDSAESLQRQQKAIQLMLEHGVDGILLCPVRQTTQEDLGILVKAGVPFVLFSRYIPGFNTDYVGAANVEGAYQAVRKMIELGHRRIIFIGGEPYTSPWFDRVKGFKRAMEESGIELPSPWYVCSEVSVAGGASRVDEVLQMRPVPTAALCYSDTVAFGFMLGLERRGIHPGRDFAVVGFDDLPESRLWRPPLATLACPPSKVGSMAIRMLLERLDGEEGPPRRVEIQSELVQRDSLCPMWNT
ncbi:MAG: LacI family DNA-binding transcriptional regulator [Spirochaetes bacterium]|nr:LacI family DNA-binding transcriptional regulator [Spirochaetota bacterium]